jgi:NDP-sugar pyrophosphorylase family protein
MTEIILLGVFPESQVVDFVGAASQRLGIPVRYLREFQPLGTGGGIYFFRDLVRNATHPPRITPIVLVTAVRRALRWCR